MMDKGIPPQVQIIHHLISTLGSVDRAQVVFALLGAVFMTGDLQKYLEELRNHGTNSHDEACKLKTETILKAVEELMKFKPIYAAMDKEIQKIMKAKNNAFDDIEKMLKELEGKAEKNHAFSF